MKTKTVRQPITATRKTVWDAIIYATVKRQVMKQKNGDTKDWGLSHEP